MLVQDDYSLAWYYEQDHWMELNGNIIENIHYYIDSQYIEKHKDVQN